jgi:hypothetical protein
MKFTTSDKLIAYLTLISGLTISAVAVWYSVAGLVAIFSAAAIPIIIMGVALEVSKLVATVWLKLNWSRAPTFIKSYLMIAIAILMLITSMGIFGFLSKAHNDQNLVSGDVQSKIAIYDEKIKTSKDNIDANRKALKQMDEAVDQVMGRSSDEKGADKAVQLRRSQQKERARLQSEIATEQKTIAAISEERAPIAAEVRKVEAEVGPLKYIAAFIYGDNPDANLLEKAVTWVIIIIVVVFDPLAVILLLASQFSFQWFRQQREEDEKEENVDEFFQRGKLVARGLDADEEQRLAKEANDKLAEIEKEPNIEATLDSIEKPVVEYKVVADADEEDLATQVGIEAWNKMIEEAEKAVQEEKASDNQFPTDPFTGQQFKLVTEEKEQYYVYNGTKWIESPLSGEDKHAAEEALKWAQEQMEDRPGDYLPESEDPKKKTTYIVKQNNQQIKKTKET